MAQANGLESLRYTPSSWAPLLPALEDVKATLRSADATQTVVDQKAATLATAIACLVEQDAGTGSHPSG